MPRLSREASAAPSSLRLGLCCQFSEHPIGFRTTTAASLLRLKRRERLAKLADLCRANAGSLMAALEYCAEHRIGSFRVLSTLLPVKTHPEAGYAIEELPDAESLVAEFRRAGEFARQAGIRVTFHPDQFVVLNSPRADVVKKSIADLEYHAQLADWLGADVINIHAGGAYGDKATALAALARTLDGLPARIHDRLTLENDDKVFAPADLLPVCRAHGVPLVYDVHHHRCWPDGLTEEEAFGECLTTWNREPLFHVSSPLEGWSGPKPERHHDYIDPADVPASYRQASITVEVEAKAKELAVLRLRSALRDAKVSSDWMGPLRPGTGRGNRPRRSGLSRTGERT